MLPCSSAICSSCTDSSLLNFKSFWDTSLRRRSAPAPAWSHSAAVWRLVSAFSFRQLDNLSSLPPRSTASRWRSDSCSFRALLLARFCRVRFLCILLPAASGFLFLFDSPQAVPAFPCQLLSRWLRLRLLMCSSFISSVWICSLQNVDPDPPDCSFPLVASFRLSLLLLTHLPSSSADLCFQAVILRPWLFLTLLAVSSKSPVQRPALSPRISFSCALDLLRLPSETGWHRRSSALPLTADTPWPPLTGAPRVPPAFPAPTEYR